eukprot:SAG31_NODE_1719_length_7455_cov_7.529772_8_plen_74_part_00
MEGMVVHGAWMKRRPARAAASHRIDIAAAASERGGRRGRRARARGCASPRRAGDVRLVDCADGLLFAARPRST